MAATIMSSAIVGLDAVLIDVTVDVSSGPPRIVLVGLPDAAVPDGYRRLSTAIHTAGGRVPDRTVTVQLSPLDLLKDGATFDLPIAIGILLASDQLVADLSDALLVGELSPDGAVQRTPAILTMVAMAATNRLGRAFVAVEDAEEAGLIEGITVYPTPTLAALVAHLMGDVRITPLSPENLDAVAE